MKTLTIEYSDKLDISLFIEILYVIDSTTKLHCFSSINENSNREICFESTDSVIESIKRITSEEFTEKE